MDPIFTEEQLNRMSREDMLSLVKIMQDHYQKQGVALQKQKDTLQKQETRIQLLEEKTKELEFLNAMLSDRLTLAQRKRFGASSENRTWKRSIRLLTRGRNVPAKRRKTFPPLRQPKSSSTNWQGQTVTARTAIRNTRLSQRKP